MFESVSQPTIGFISEYCVTSPLALSACWATGPAGFAGGLSSFLHPVDIMPAPAAMQIRKVVRKLLVPLIAHRWCMTGKTPGLLPGFSIQEARRPDPWTD